MRPMRRDLRPEMVWAAAAAALGVLLYTTFVLADLGRWFDDAALGGRVLPPPDVLRSMAPRATSAGVALLAVAAAVAIVVAVVQGRRRQALTAAAYVIGAEVAAQAIKSGLDRVPDTEPAGMPSGHATAAIALAVAVAVLVPPRARIAAVAAGGLVAGLVGLGIVAGNSHRPADIVGAGLLCIAVAAAARAIGRAAGQAPPAPPEWRTPGAVVAAVVLWAPAMATLAAFAVAVALGTDLPAGTSDAGFYAVAWPVAATAPAAAVVTVVCLGLDPTGGAGEATRD